MSDQSLVLDLASIVGDQYASDDPVEMWCYAADNLPQSPQCVVKPGSTEEVASVVRLARQRRIPVVPRGLASRATPGGKRPQPSTKGGIIVDMTRMNRIRDICDKTMTVTVEAGMTMAKLNTELAPMGYRVIESTLAPFCATAGSITGNGPGASKYGARQQLIVDLEVVLGTGEILQTEPSLFGAGLATKYKSPNLTEIFFKGRGTMGIVTAVTFLMFELPEYHAYANYAFADCEDTVKFLLALQRKGITHLPAVYEVYLWPSHTLMLLANVDLTRTQNPDFERLLSNMPPYPADVVGIVLEGTERQVRLQVGAIDEIADAFGGRNVGPEPIRDHYVDRVWEGNTKAHEDVFGRYGGWAEPHFECRIDCYPAARELTARIAEELGFKVGERYWRGSRLSVRMLTNSAAITFDATDREEWERAGEYYRRVAQEAAQLAGMASHRVNPEHMALGVSYMERIRQIMDPDAIMYPGVDVMEE